MNSSCKAAAMSKGDTMLLVQLVAANTIINNKATNAVNNRLKENAWQTLTKEFNSSVSSFPRTPSQLRLKWENLKKSARKRCASLRSNLNKTGGGKDYFPPNEVLDKVASLLGSTSKGNSVSLGGDTGIPVKVTEGVSGTDRVVDGNGEGCVYSKNVASPVEVLNVEEIGISLTPTPLKKSFYFGQASSSVLLAKRKLKMEEEKCRARISRDNALTNYINAKQKKLDLEITKTELEIENAKLENIALKKKLNLLD